MNSLTSAYANQLLAEWPALSLRTVLLGPSYLFDRLAPAAIAEADTVAVSDIMTGLAVLDGWARADPARFSGVAPGQTVSAAALVQVETPEVPFVFMDEATRFPMKTVGTLFWLTWQAEGIFRL